MKKILIIVLLFLKFSAAAQEDEYSFLRQSSLNDSAKISAGINLHTFFKNNEYFGDFIKGYTLTGWHCQPEITANFNKSLKIQVLWNVLRYNGYDKYTENCIYPRIVFKPRKSFTMICGYLEGNVKHKMLEPIYNPERYYTENMENGLQFLWKTNRYDGDMWLNWEKFILWDDPWQEKLTFGQRSDFNLVKTDFFQAGLTGEILISHRGGQIDSSPGQVQSLENGALGFQLHFFGNAEQNFRQFSFYSMFVQFHCIDETPDIPFLNGFGLYNKALIKIKDFALTCGYWYADRFMNFRGDKLFTCQAIKPEDNVRKRHVVFNEFYYYKTYFNGVFTLKAGANSYWDLKAGNMEYSYMLSLIFRNAIKR